jgi:Glycosyltransferase family 87
MNAASPGSGWLTPIRRRALADGFWLLAIVSLVAYLVIFVLPLWVGLDGHAYWEAWQGSSLYSAAPATRDAFLYSPLFAESIRPLAALPWPLFLGSWIVIQALVFAWLLQPVPGRWFLVAYLACVPEILEANVNGLYALMIVLGFRWSASWAFALITKIAPAVGLLWFAVRREWGRLLIPLLVTGLLAALSYLIWPTPWSEWLAFLSGNAGAGGSKTILLIPRLVLAVAVVGLGAWTGRRWTVPLAVVLASPVFFLNTLTVLAAVPRLRAMGPAGPARPFRLARRGPRPAASGSSSAGSAPGG